MKSTQKKLNVKRDTLRALSAAELRALSAAELRALSAAELRPVGGAVGASIDTWGNPAPSCAWTCNFSICDCPPPP